MTTDVDQIIQEARSAASDMRGAAQTAIVDALGWVQHFQAVEPIKSPPSNFMLPAPPPAIDISSIDPVELGVVSLPNITSLQGVQPIDTGGEPSGVGTAPELILPATPTQFASRNLPPPSVQTDFVFPEAPSIRLLDAPVAANHVLPSLPTIMLPEFAGVAPGETPTPGDFTGQMTAAYREQAPSMFAALEGQLDVIMGRIMPGYQNGLIALEDKLTTFLRGGTALPPAIEDAIFERTRGKVNAEYRRMRETAFLDAAKRGFTIPDGALQSATQQARVASGDANARAAAEIAIKQAELEQQNMQFALTTSTALRNAALSASIGYHQNLISINGQALDYSKTVLGALVSVYEAQVKAFEARLDLYKANAQVYETQMRAAQVHVDLYRAELSGTETLVRIDEVRMNTYRAQVEALNAAIGVYRGQVEAVASRAQVEKLKVELFGETVRAYAVEAQAKQAEWQGYSAAVQGQEARLHAFGEEVQAYRAQVDAFRAKIEARRAGVEAATAYNDGIARQNVGLIEAYKAQVEAGGLVASTMIEVQKTKLLAETARFGALNAAAQTAQQYYSASATVASERYRAETAFALGKAEVATKQISAAVAAAGDGARVFEGIASAAMMGVNAIASSAISG